MTNQKGYLKDFVWQTKKKIKNLEDKKSNGTRSRSIKRLRKDLVKARSFLGNLHSQGL